MEKESRSNASPGISEIKERINRSKIFTGEIVKGTPDYTKEERLLLDQITHLLFEREENREYGVELFNTFYSCLKYFSPEEGDFYSYFCRSFKAEKNRAKHKELLTRENGGVRIPVSGKVYSIYKDFCKFSKGSTAPESESRYAAIQAYGAMKNIPPEKVKYYVLTCEATASVSGDEELEEDDLSRWDTIAGDSDTEGSVLDREIIKEKARKINGVFQSLQERQKPLFSLWITGSIVSSISDPDFLRLFLDYPYFDRETAQKTVRDKPFSQKEIAEMLGKDETAVSRTIRGLREKLKEIL